MQLTKKQSEVSRRLRKEFTGADFNLWKWEDGWAFLIIGFANANQIRVELLAV